MKLKVICQVCGKTGLIDTNKTPIEDGGWQCEKVMDLVSNLEEGQDWDAWFCGECYHLHVEDPKDRGIPLDEFEAFFELLFKISKEDKEEA